MVLSLDAVAQAHAMKAAGSSLAEIAQRFGRHPRTIREWLSQPAPGEEDLRHFRSRQRSTTAGGLRQIKSYHNEETAERLAAEALEQRTSCSQIMALALSFYLDATAWLRNPGDEASPQLRAYIRRT